MSSDRYAEEIQAVRDAREALRQETLRRGLAMIEASWGIERILDRMRRIPKRLGRLDRETSPISAGVKVCRTLEFIGDTALWLDAEETNTTKVLGDDDDDENHKVYKGVVAAARSELAAQRAHLRKLATTLERAEEDVIRKMARAVADVNLAPVVKAKRAEQLAKGVRNLRSVFIDLPRAVNELAGEGPIETRLARIDAMLVMARNLRLLLPDLVGAPELDEARAELTEVIERRLSMAQALRDVLATQALRLEVRKEPVNDEGPADPSPIPSLLLPPEEEGDDPKKVSWAQAVELGAPLDEELPGVWDGEETCEPRELELQEDCLVKGEQATFRDPFQPVPMPTGPEIEEALDAGPEDPPHLRNRVVDAETRVQGVAEETDDAALVALAAELGKLNEELVSDRAWLKKPEQILVSLEEISEPQLKELTAEVRGNPVPLSVAYPTMNPDEVAVMNALDPGAVIGIGLAIVNPTFIPVPPIVTAGLLAYAAADLLTRFVTQVAITEWVLSWVEDREPDKEKLTAFGALLDVVQTALDFALLNKSFEKKLESTKDAIDKFRDLKLAEDVIARLVEVWRTGSAARDALLEAIPSPATCRGVLPTLEQASTLVTAMSDRDVPWSASVTDTGKTVVWSGLTQPVRVEIHQAKGATPGWVKLSHGIWAVDSVGKFVSHDAASARIPLTSLTEGLSAALLRRIFDDPLPGGAPK